MDLDNAVVTIPVFLALIGGLPFFMARLESSLHDAEEDDRR